MVPDSEGLALVFIHGVGGLVPEDRWARPLSEAMSQTGHSRPEESGVSLVTIDYRSTLVHPDEQSVPLVKSRSAPASPDQYVDYRDGVAHARNIARRHRTDPPLAIVPLPGGKVADLLALAVEQCRADLRNEAHPYRTDAKLRASVLKTVVGQLPQHGRIVIVAHSLGSVVALDLIKWLPATVRVERLITLGSPLSLRRLWPFIETEDSFPYDRVRSWVNVFDSRDPVADGRGTSRHFPESLDVDVNVGSFARLVDNHAAQTYLSLPLVGALVGDALYGEPAGESDDVPALGYGNAWDLYLLAAAYARQLSITCDKRKHSWRRRFDMARRASVERMLGELQDAPVEVLKQRGAYPMPGHADFLDHAAAHVKGLWSDDELLSFAVALVLSSPVRPYDMDIDEAHAKKALTALLDRVRAEGGVASDQDFAEAVIKALDEAKDALGGRAWWPYLMLAGAAVLAATGVGLWAAMPAGLAGAAALTSTLAAFGPGGMVGGMVTIAAASGTGSALLGAAAVATPQEVSLSVVRFADELSELSLDHLRATVTAMLAVVMAQESLGVPSTAERVRSILIATQVNIQNEENDHLALGSEGAKGWAAKRKLVDRAIRELDDRFPDRIRDAIVTGMSPTRGLISGVTLRQLGKTPDSQD